MNYVYVYTFCSNLIMFSSNTFISRTSLATVWSTDLSNNSSEETWENVSTTRGPDLTTACSPLNNRLWMWFSCPSNICWEFVSCLILTVWLINEDVKMLTAPQLIIQLIFSPSVPLEHTHCTTCALLCLTFYPINTRLYKQVHLQCSIYSVACCQTISLQTSILNLKCD